MTIIETTLGDFSGEALEWEGEFRIVECGRALSPSGLDHMDYALNPYGGCEHGCIYCYAPGHTRSDPATWRVVRVKRNVADRLARELPFAEGVIGIGTVTDPYQAAEGRFRLTRSCLEILSARGREVHMHTKSDLVLRDLDLLAGMRATVAVTFTSVDDRVSRMTEPGAPLPGARLRALRGLVDAGVDCYALVAPVMSTVRGTEGAMMDALASAGVGRAMIDPLNLRLVDTTRLDRMGITPCPDCESALADAARDRGIRVFRRSGHPGREVPAVRAEHRPDRKCSYRRSKLSNSQE